LIFRKMGGGKEGGAGRREKRGSLYLVSPSAPTKKMGKGGKRKEEKGGKRGGRGGGNQIVLINFW